MTRLRLLPVAGLLCLVTGCASFADRGVEPTASAGTSADPGTATGSAAGTGDLEIIDETDLTVPAGTVTGARVVLDPDGTPTTLLVTSSGATVSTAGATTAVSGTVVVDLVVRPDGPLAVTLTADPVSPDPVLGMLPVGSGQAPNGSGPAPAPAPFRPEQTAPRGLPVFAALGPDGDTLYVLAESPDGVAATLYAVDPDTGALQDSAAVDTGLADVTALDLAGLAVTGAGELVVGLTLDSGDELAAGGSASMLLRVDADLRPSGEPVDVQPGTERAPLLAVTTDADGEPVALLSDPARGLTLVRPDLDTGATETAPLADADLGSRAAGLAVGAAGAVTALPDQGSPTVALAPTGSATPTTIELCNGAGDALAVAAGPDGTFLVAGTCNGESRLWTLG